MYQQYEQGGINEVFAHRDVLDATVGTVSIGATILTGVGFISNPVGLGIGVGVLIYYGGTMIYNHYNK